MISVNDIKTSLRISHSKLDNEIGRDIEAAKLELERVGVNEAVINGGSELIDYAVETYVMYRQALRGKEIELADGYLRSFEHQANSIRRSSHV